MIGVSLSRDAAKFLDRLPAEQRRQITVKLAQLGDNPRPNDSVAMKGTAKGYLRADAGEYRIVYQIAPDMLRVFAIGKRNDAEVYRKLGR